MTLPISQLSVYIDAARGLTLELFRSIHEPHRSRAGSAGQRLRAWLRKIATEVRNIPHGAQGAIPQFTVRDLGKVGRRSIRGL
jgi:hypothetical protein